MSDTWRIGSQVPINVYEGDRPVCQCQTPEDAKRIVDALNGIEGHNQPCYYCGEPCNALAGNPSKWPLAFPHRDEPGVVKWQHVGCVVARLAENQPVGIAEAVKATEEAQSERIIALLKRNGVVEGPRGFIAEIRRLDQPGALDRYVASKVREAKAEAYERCASVMHPHMGGLLLTDAGTVYNTLCEWAEAERKESNAPE